MFANAKPLVVVLGLALAFFWWTRPVWLNFMAPEDFARRRNVWLFLTATAFLAPGPWFYLAVAVPVLIYATVHDRNPCGIYVATMFLLPPIPITIPVVGINQLFDLSQLRMLSLVVLMTALLRPTPPDAPAAQGPRMVAADWALLGFGVLQLVLLTPYETGTNTLRRAFLFFIDVYLVFRVFSRSPARRETLADTMACYCMVMCVAAAIAIFETLKGWLLYTGINVAWGVPNEFAWLMRGQSLRAQASAGHSLLLGYLLAMGFGFWLYLGHGMERRLRLPITLLLAGGLVATYSRGPWLTALIFLFTYFAMKPGGRRLLVKTMLGFVVVGALVAVSPWGSDIIDRLPFVGSIDQGNIDYRQQLATLSWQLIQNNLWFGDPFVTLQMESLRQGQGIVDLVNAYATVALFYGMAGLSMFLLFFGSALWSGFAATRRALGRDDDLADLGAVLVAALVSSLFFIATALVGPEQYLLAGLVAAFALAAPRETAPAAEAEEPAVLPAVPAPLGAWGRPAALRPPTQTR